MKYKVPIYVVTQAQKIVGFIECDTYSQYKKKLKEFEEQGQWEDISVNISNDFEVDDSRIDFDLIQNADSLKYYEE